VTPLDDVTQRLLSLALEEDLAGGDATAAATVPADARATAVFVARAPGIVAGLDATRAVVKAVDGEVTFRALATPGDAVARGARLAKISGSARSLLAAERTALNVLSHLSGVATGTAAFVDEVAGTGCAVRDTRKTLPGLRALQKAAVAAGGGGNHRFNLGDGLLVKDNHVAAAGGVGAATRAALAAAGELPVQIEVDSAEQLAEALDAGARAVLLDNFTLDEITAAVAYCRRAGTDVFVEVSGNVTLDTVGAIARTGVDAVAVGALTHSVRALDIGLDWQEA
jgi:nicotinate-nucleotide pyrophosphorylase (carboxylating)